MSSIGYPDAVKSRPDPPPVIVEVGNSTSDSSSDSESSDSSSTTVGGSSHSGSVSSSSDDGVAPAGSLVVHNDGVEVGSEEDKDPSLNLSLESFKSADATLTRQLEIDLLQAEAVDVCDMADPTPQNVDGVELLGPGQLANALEGPKVASTPQEVAGSGLFKIPINPTNPIIAENCIDSLAPNPPSASKDPIPVPIKPNQLAAALKAAIPLEPAFLRVRQQIDSQGACAGTDKPADNVGDKSKIGKPDKIDKDKDKVEKSKKSKKDKEGTEVVQSVGVPSVAPVDQQISEGQLLARMVAKFFGSSTTPGPSPKGTKSKRKKVKRVKPTKSKKRRRHESVSDSGSGSSQTSSDQAPTTSSRIPRISDSRRYQQQAMSRARLVGQPMEEDAQVAELTNALQVLDETELEIDPSLAYYQFHSVLGTGLPYIQEYVNSFRNRYGLLTKATLRLQLTSARDRARAIAAAPNPDPSNPFAAIWQFNNDFKMATPSSLSAMENAPGPSGSQASASVSGGAVDFSQLPMDPSTSSKDGGLKRRHKSGRPSSRRELEAPRAASRRKDKTRVSKKKKHKSHRKEVFKCVYLSII